ncbi:hypothetical protein GCM10023195_76880 [Actinoallomurus liliacearum]|uniref:ATP/GTP-binding protein n=1 Tax=Actinoallomurus liliacearum TaxID=1080073 RepID=A0ABP8TV44_9ACTN
MIAGPHSYNPFATTRGKVGTSLPMQATIRRSAADPKHNLPPYCAEAAAASRVVGALSPIAGRPMVCGNEPASAVTPQELAQSAWKGLNLPIPAVRTAPPHGSEGLVGLPEWVWVPRGQWRSLSQKASAGAVWAEVTATPKQMVIEPGPGLPTVTCPGPGTVYDPVKPASGQHTDCSFTYRRSSAAEPGAVYRVKVTVVWGGSWVGSGGAGGALPDISRSTTFGLKVAEAQGLYGGGAGR